MKEISNGLPNIDRVAFLDWDATGLRPDRIHCVAVRYRGWTEVFEDAAELETFLNDNRPDYIVAHNGIGYDFPVLNNTWNLQGVASTLDTLVLSRLASPSRSGGHSLRNWGNITGTYKGDYDGGWEVYTPEMREYCIGDVLTLESMWQKLQEELKDFSWRSIELEHRTAEIIGGQVAHGWFFRRDKAIDLLGKLKEKQYEVEEQVQSVFVPLATAGTEVEPRYKQDGTLSKVGLKFLGDRYVEVGGPLTRIDFPAFNLGSRQQIAKYLIRFGWKPKVFTETGQPKVDETILEKVKGIPEASLIAEYLMVQKRAAQVSSWIEACTDEQRIHGKVRTNGAVTGRMTHDSPNVAQVPASNKPYGEECRSCWSVPEGFLLVGTDASGLELRMLAHYMDDDGYTKELLSGDIHTANQRAAGLPTRDDAKTFIYAFLYGAGDAKIGTIVGGNAQDGRELKNRFLRNTPSLKKLRERVDRASSKGYLKGLDGRRLYVRSTHASLNTLLQGGGAVVMKDALVTLDDFKAKWKLHGNFVGNIHDEIQAEVREDHAERFGQLAVSCIQAAGNHFNLRCPLDGEYNVGTSWADTH